MAPVEKTLEPRWIHESPRHIMVGLHLLLVMALLFYFRDVLFGPYSLFYRDIFNFHFPLWETSARLFHAHGFSCWNPLNHFGQNMTGNPNYLMFYPPAWLRFVMDPLSALNWFIVLHLAAGGITFSWLGRRWGLSPWPAGMVGLAYSFCGISFSICCILNLVPYLWLAPLCLLLLEELLQRPRFHALAGLALGAALLVTVFEPVLIFGLAIIMGLRCLIHLWSPTHRAEWRRLVGRLLLAFALALVVAAPVLAEGWRLFQVSPRTEAGDIQQDLYAQPPALTLGFWVANPFDVSFSMQEGVQGEITRQGQVPYFFCMFIGLISLVLIPQGLGGCYRHRVWLWLGGGLFFLVLAWGEHCPWVYEMARHLPLLSWARYMQKLLFFTSFLWIMAAAFGLEELVSRPATGRWSRIPALLAGMVGVAVILAWAHWGAGSRVNGLWPVSLLAAVGALFLLALRRSGRQSRGLALVLGLVWCAELAMGNVFAVPQTPRILFAERVPILQAVNCTLTEAALFRVTVEKEPTHYRYFGQSDSIVWKYNMLRMAGYPYSGFSAGISYAFNFVVDKMEPRHSMVLRQLYAAASPADRRHLMQRWGVGFLITHGEYMDPQLELLGRFATYSDTPYRLYRVRDGVGRYFFTTRTERPALPVTDLAEVLLAAAPGTILLAEERASSADTGPATGSSPTAIRMLHHAPDMVALETQNAFPGWVVLQDTFYPGWAARVDGEVQEIFRADFFFRAVPVPAGRHRVEFVYEPAGGKALWFFSGGVAFLLGAFVVALFLRASCRRGSLLSSRRKGDLGS